MVIIKKDISSCKNKLSYGFIDGKIKTLWLLECANRKTNNFLLKKCFFLYRSCKKQISLYTVYLVCYTLYTLHSERNKFLNTKNNGRLLFFSIPPQKALIKINQ